MSMRMIPYHPNGFTLVEVMVVVTILSILLGMSSGFFTHFENRQALSSTVLRVHTIFRSAKQIAREENCKSIVRINKSDSLVELWGNRLVGFWHCDDPITTGAFGFHANSKGLQNSPGKINQSLQISSEKKIDFGRWKQFNIGNGFILGAWVYIEKSSSKEQVLWQIGGYLTLEMTQEQKLKLKVSNQHNTAENSLPMYQWHYLELEYGLARKIQLRVNHVVYLEQSCDFPSTLQHTSLTFGAGFRGKLDQIELHSWNLLEEYSIPRAITIQQAPSEVVFSPKGHLELKKHRILTPIMLERIENSQKGTIEISPFGIIRYRIF